MTGFSPPGTGHRLTPFLLLAPVLAVLSISFVAPILWLFRMSLNESDFGAIIEALSLGTYIRILNDGYYLDLLGRTLQLSVTCSLVALALAGMGLELTPLVIGLPVAAVVLIAGTWIPFLKREVPTRPQKPRRQTAAYRWSRVIQHRPWPEALAGAAVLLVLSSRSVRDLRRVEATEPVSV